MKKYSEYNDNVLCFLIKNFHSIYFMFSGTCTCKKNRIKLRDFEQKDRPKEVPASLNDSEIPCLHTFCILVSLKYRHQSSQRFGVWVLGPGT